MSLSSSSIVNPYEVPIPKFDHKSFNLPKWNDSFGGRDEWRRKAIQGLQTLGGIGILKEGYKPVLGGSDLVSSLPQTMLPMAMTKDSFVDLTLDVQAEDGTVQQMSQVPIKSEHDTLSQGTSSSSSSDKETKKDDEKDQEIARLRAELEALKAGKQSSGGSQSMTDELHRLMADLRSEQNRITQFSLSEYANPLGTQESYVVRNHLRLYLNERRVFVHPVTRQPEPQRLTQIRAFLAPKWRASFVDAPEVIKGVIGDDLLQMFVNEVNFNKPIASFSYADISQKFSNHMKTTNMSFTEWEDTLNLYLREMSALGHPKPDYEIKAVIITAFTNGGDKRYREATRKVLDKPSLRQEEVLAIYRARALVIKDLASEKANKQSSNKAAQSASAATSSSSNARNGKGKKKKRKQKPKGEPAQTANAATTGSKGVCLSWVSKGVCTRENCKFEHTTAEQLMQRIKGAKGDKNKLSTSEKSKADKSTADCRHWLNGNCVHGDSCAFSHEEGKRGAAKLEKSQTNVAMTNKQAQGMPKHDYYPDITDIVVPAELCAPEQELGDLWDENWLFLEGETETHTSDESNGQFFDSVSNMCCAPTPSRSPPKGSRNSLQTAEYESHNVRVLEIDDFSKNRLSVQVGDFVSAVEHPTPNRGDGEQDLNMLYHAMPPEQHSREGKAKFYASVRSTFMSILAIFWAIEHLFNFKFSDFRDALCHGERKILVRASLNWCEIVNVTRTFTILIFSFFIAVSLCTAIDAFSAVPHYHEAHVVTHVTTPSGRGEHGEYDAGDRVLIRSCLQCPKLEGRECTVVSSVERPAEPLIPTVVRSRCRRHFSVTGMSEREKGMVPAQDRVRVPVMAKSAKRFFSYLLNMVANQVSLGCNP